MMKKLLLLAFFGPLLVLGQSAGFNSTFIILSVNGGSNVYYDLQASTGNPDFNNANLGTFNVGTTNLVFKGAEHNVWRCGSANISSTRLYYRIYPQNAPTGSYVSNTVFYNSGFNNGCSGQDQKWLINGSNVNLLNGLSAGSYTIEVYSDASTDNCCGGVIYAGNNGNNYKANFTLSCPTIAAPTIASGPTILCQGDQTILTSNQASGNQWYKNGVAISGANSTNITINTAGSYTLNYIQNGCTSQTSTATIVQVNSIPSSPSITAGSSTSLCPTESVSLTASGSGHQWYKNGTALSGSTSATLTTSESGAYTVITTVNGCSSAASSPTAVDMNTATAITQQPSSSTQSVLSGANLVVNAAGTNLQFQWQVSSNSGSTWADIASPAGLANFYNPAPSSNSVYRCVVTGTCGTVTSNASGVVTAIPVITLSNASCNNTLNSMSSGISAINVPNASAYRFTITPSGSQTSYQVTSPDRWFALSEASGMALYYGTQYSVTIEIQGATGAWGTAGAACTVTTPSIPTTTLSNYSCDQTLTSMSSGISANNVHLAAMYRFTITPIIPNASSYTVDSPDRWIALTEATGMPLWYGTNYSITVAIQNGTGTWGNPGNPCTVTTPTLPTTMLSATSCGATLTSLSSGISANNVQSAALYRFTITPNIQNATSYIVNSPDCWIALTEATGMPLWYGTTYEITVAIQNGSGAWGNPGTACAVTTPTLPTTMLSATSCGATLGSLSAGISANTVQSAAMYRFTITPNTPNATSYTVDSPDRWIALTEATGMPLLYGTTYSIVVAVQNGTGDWSNDGTACMVTTPAIPTIGLSTASCGATLQSLGSGISAINIAAAAQYEFQIINQTQGQAPTEYYVISPDRWITLSEGLTTINIPLVPQNNQQYVIRVRAYNGTLIGEYAEVGCVIHTPVTQGIIVQEQDPQLHEEQTEGLGVEESSNVNGLEVNQIHNTIWTATATSNPFATSFQIKLNGAEGLSTDASFTAQLTDMSGKVYSQATLTKGQLEAESFGEQLAPGMYFMTLRQGEELRAIRVVKR